MVAEDQVDVGGRRHEQVDGRESRLRSPVVLDEVHLCGAKSTNQYLGLRITISYIQIARLCGDRRRTLDPLLEDVVRRQDRVQHPLGVLVDDKDLPSCGHRSQRVEIACIECTASEFAKLRTGGGGEPRRGGGPRSANEPYRDISRRGGAAYAFVSGQAGRSCCPACAGRGWRRRKGTQCRS